MTRPFCLVPEYYGADSDAIDRDGLWASVRERLSRLSMRGIRMEDAIQVALDSAHSTQGSERIIFTPSGLPQSELVDPRKAAVTYKTRRML